MPKQPVATEQNVVAFIANPYSHKISFYELAALFFQCERAWRMNHFSMDSTKETAQGNQMSILMDTIKTQLDNANQQALTDAAMVALLNEDLYMNVYDLDTLTPNQRFVEFHNAIDTISWQLWTSAIEAVAHGHIDSRHAVGLAIADNVYRRQLHQDLERREWQAATGFCHAHQADEARQRNLKA